MKNKTSLSSPKRNPARLITRLARLITSHFDRELSCIDLKVAYLPVLGALREKKQLTQKELVAVGHISQSAMAQMLDRMVKDGLLIRSVSTEDRRASLFMLSKKALASMTKLERIIEAENEILFSSIGNAGLEKLIALLEEIEKKLIA